MLAPEGEIRGGLAPLVPAGQRGADVFGRGDRLAAVYPFDVADFHAGEAIPPGG